MPLRRTTSREDIVITGIACRFAGAANIAEFWGNILERKSAFSKIPPEEDDDFLPPPPPLSGADLPLWSARLGSLYSCRAADQYFPHELNCGENQDLFLCVQLASDALRDSGFTPRAMPTDRVSLHIGYAPPFNAASANWLQHTFFLSQTLGIVRKFFPSATRQQLGELQNKLLKSLPTPNSFALLSAMGSTISSWTSHWLGFAGPAETVDSGVSSGISALQFAIDDLHARRADVALAGAFQPPVSRTFLAGIAGTCRFTTGSTLQPFSREARGTLPGEGGAFFVLKRLKDAQKQGDRIYAIVRSTGIVAASLDARQRVPNPERLERAINRALKEAEVEPKTIQLAELHGSGVPHTDRTELAVLNKILGPKTLEKPMTGVGSVKGNIGHTLWAAGTAGAAKCALAIAHGILPPHVQTDRPYSPLVSGEAPFYLIDAPRPWLRGNKKEPRRALVASVDFTGSCAAAVLEEYPE